MQLARQCERAFERIKVVNGLVPFVFVESGRLLRVNLRAGRNDKKIVGQNARILCQFHLIVLRVNGFDGRNNKLDAGRNKIPFRFHHILCVIYAERDKQKARLVIVCLVLVNECDLPFVT